VRALAAVCQFIPKLCNEILFFPRIAVVNELIDFLKTTLAELTLLKRFTMFLMNGAYYTQPNGQTNQSSKAESTFKTAVCQ